MTSTGQDPRLGTTIDGKYRLDARIGRGGMGTIYRATHLMLEKTVAVKIINTNLDASPEFVARFRREARAASNLDHPNIVAVYDLGQAEDGALYLAMEYVDGRSLKDIIREEGRIAPARIVRLLGQVAGALAAAHRGQIVHRDLKPHNVMVSTDADGAETAKLLDFGIAKVFDDASTQLTATGATIGTPQYMSPEQAGGRDIDGRSDLYSLGIILYEMLVGEVPFSDPSTPAVLVKHLTEPPTRPSVRRPDLQVSPALEAVALRCLEKDPEARYQTAEDVITALEQAATGTDRAGAAVVAVPVSADAPTVVVPGPTAPTPAAEAQPPAPSVESSSAGGALPGGGNLPPPSAFQNLTSAPGRQAADTPAGTTRSRGSTIFPMVALLVLMGGIGLVAYFLGYFSSEQPPVAPDPVSVETGADVEPPQTPGPVATASEGGAVPTPAEAQSAAREAATPPPVTPAAPPPAPPAVVRTPPPEAAASVPPVQPDPLPERPSVSLFCEGAANVCAALRAAMDQELGRQSMPSVADADTAEILIDAVATEGPSRVQESFGTTFVIRSFTVAFTASARRLPQALAMPAPTTFSYDERVGAQRLNEQSRLMTTAVIDRVRAYWAEHAGG